MNAVSEQRAGVPRFKLIAVRQEDLFFAARVIDKIAVFVDKHHQFVECLLQLFFVVYFALFGLVHEALHESLQGGLGLEVRGREPGHVRVGRKGLVEGKAEVGRWHRWEVVSVGHSLIESLIEVLIFREERVG